MRNFSGGASETDRLARLSGLLYFLVLPTAGFWFYTSASLFGPTAGTFAALEAGRDKLELAIVLGAVGHVIQLAVAVIFHRLLSPFGKVASNLMLTFLAVSVPLSFAALAREMDLLSLLDGGRAAPLLGPDQLQAQITLTIGAYTSLYQTASCFWGLWLFPLGWLLLRSGFVPRVIAVCVALGGAMYVMAFVGPVLDPGYSSSVAATAVGVVSGIPDLVGEIGTALWLAVRGARGAKAPTLAAAPAG